MYACMVGMCILIWNLFFLKKRSKNLQNEKPWADQTHFKKEKNEWFSGDFPVMSKYNVTLLFSVCIVVGDISEMIVVNEKFINVNDVLQ